jgi:hypothetical protein
MYSWKFLNDSSPSPRRYYEYEHKGGEKIYLWESPTKNIFENLPSGCVIDIKSYNSARVVKKKTKKAIDNFNNEVKNASKKR